MTRKTFYGAALGVLAADQVSKIWAVSALSDGGTVPVVPGYLVFHLVHNRGAAFGLFPSGTVALIVVAALAAALLLWTERRGLPGPLWALALGLELGGAVGNLIDRLRLGYVIDFIELDWKGHNIWPVFNIADSAITVGTILLVFLLWRSEPSTSVPAAQRTVEEKEPDTRTPPPSD